MQIDRKKWPSGIEIPDSPADKSLESRASSPRFGVRWLGLMILAGAGILGEGAEENEVRLGILLPVEPEEATSLRQGAELGISQANQQSGAKAKLVIRGRPGQWGTEGDEAGVLALDDHVSGIIAPTDGSPAHQILQVAGRTRIPVVSLCSDSSITGAGIPWALRITPRTDEEARALFSKVTYQDRAAMRWAAFVPAGRTGRETAQDLKAAAAASNRYLETFARLPSNQDATAEITHVLETQPEAVLLWTDATTSGQLAQKLRRARFAGRLAGPGRLCSTAFIRAAGDAADGFIVPSLTDAAETSAQWRDFQQKYRRQFSTAPDVFALLAHDAALVLIHLSTKYSQANLHNAFPLRETIDGASGPLRFDRQGNRIVSLELLVCSGGEFKPLDLVSSCEQFDLKHHTNGR